MHCITQHPPTLKIDCNLSPLSLSEECKIHTKQQHDKALYSKNALEIEKRDVFSIKRKYFKEFVVESDNIQDIIDAL